ncbi:double zinc ribbon and ankyrin repeat-containing protein 1 isoform X1 [Electrophorus electricus]|uniref:double zinc ribbon and ankyrin repeat-containing protein 1 isoform X1 n=2 Tax=Electrophorus electricus TaxID=8005 RepID=UPI0015CFB52D|nr:double zinc ribbon and ankyrin repeat-containing protein 1 isoform X1 [Electrophorus electricus]XP_035376749.1 double zinc ribbon and ankyrin repeat-containing protein 1 isoform X1 [Electrophorus electricus]
MTAGSVVAPFIIPIRVPPPGKSKHEIDTATPIEIKSDTPDVTVFYTLDGSKPEVRRRPGFGDGGTLKYAEPIRLPSGKVPVRAVAVTSDGRESAVVTKVFIVEYVPSEVQTHSVNNLEDQDYSLNNSMHDRSAQEQENGAGDASGKHLGSVESPTIAPRSVRKGPRFLPQRQRIAPAAVPTQHTHVQSAGTVHSLFKKLTRTQMSRIQRETDFLRCPECLSHRPSDPFARFCLHCGAPLPPIPGRRLPPTEGGQMAQCVQCKSMVPVNTSSCVVCEAPLEPQLQPQASLRLRDKVICPSCGTGNPAHISYCVTCETKLSQTDRPLRSGQCAPPVPSSEGKMVSCSKCWRVNHSDARFCDWCGAKPGHVASSVTCSQCGASSHPYANYCGNCGVFLEGPPRRNAQLGPQEGTLEPEQSSSVGVTWQPVPACPASPTQAEAAVSTAMHVDAQTQTVGLFYPSGTELQRKIQKRELELSKQEKMSDRKPLLTAISPGRGFWRKQLDHICAHLRSYAQNNSEFRALVGEPRMGRLVSAAIEEDSYEVSLRVNFISASLELSRSSSAGQLSRFVAEKHNLSTVTEGRANLARNHTSLVSENGSAIFGTSTKSQKQSITLESKDSLLLKEVGPEGLGRIAVVQQLLDEGANPSCLGSDTRPVLVAAVLNGHHDVIPVLVQKGADVDQASGPLNNTALHEAAALGREALQCAEVLLGCNTSLRKLNDEGQTPYDIAESTGCSALLSLMMSHRGQGLAQPLPNSRSPSGLDTFS